MRPASRFCSGAAGFQSLACRGGFHRGNAEKTAALQGVQARGALLFEKSKRERGEKIKKKNSGAPMPAHPAILQALHITTNEP